MKEKRTLTPYILLLLIIGIFVGIAAAEQTFYSGCYISASTTTSASVQGTINETVSLTKTTFGGDVEKTELRTSYTSENPFGLSWRSLVSVRSDEGTTRVDYTRSGDLPDIHWREYL
jgi:hypothetical protein